MQFLNSDCFRKKNKNCYRLCKIKYERLQHAHIKILWGVWDFLVLISLMLEKILNAFDNYKALVPPFWNS